MKVLIVDHHILFREGLASLLNSEPDFKVVGEADTAASAVEKAIGLQPELVLIDTAFPDNNGIKALRELAASLPETKIVILTSQFSDEQLFEAIRAGAVGYLLKDKPVSNLLIALRAVERGEPAISRNMTSRILEEFRRVNVISFSSNPALEMLTAREIEVLMLLAQDASTEQIANSLVISENTVKVHIHNIIKKLNVRNRKEAGSLARRLNFSGFTGESAHQQVNHNLNEMVERKSRPS